MKLSPKDRNAIIGGIKRVWHRHPRRLEVMKRVRKEEPRYRKDGSKAAKPQVFYICEACGAKAKPGRTAGGYPQVHIDHIDPVVPVDTVLDDMTLDRYVERLFCDVSNLQALCSTCHNAKTQAERRLRRRR